MKEIKQSVNWAVGWIAYRYTALSIIAHSRGDESASCKANKNLIKLRKIGEKVLSDWR
jgi:Na+(H+)/acetate symporter ActP